MTEFYANPRGTDGRRRDCKSCVLAARRERAAEARERRAMPLVADCRPAVASMSITAAARVGDIDALLVSLRDRVAQAVDVPTTPSRDLGPLTRILQELANEIARRSRAP